jgi:YfiH family protein
VLTTSVSGGTLAAEMVPGAPAVVISVKQVHGTDVLVLDRPITTSERLGGGWDALITNQPRVLLTVRTADCVPVLIQDPERHVVGAVHAGWRGTVAGIVRKTIERMAKRFGSDPKMLRFAIGPSIGPCCYEVDAPVLERVRDMEVDWREAVEDRGGGKAMLDLRLLVRTQAQASGVPLQSVESVGLCTACHLDLFYSYRREGAVVGTMYSGIMLTGTATQQQHKASV